MPSFIIVRYVWQILGRGAFLPPHPWAAPKLPILDRFKITSAWLLLNISDNFNNFNIQKRKSMMVSCFKGKTFRFSILIPPITKLYGIIRRHLIKKTFHVVYVFILFCLFIFRPNSDLSNLFFYKFSIKQTNFSLFSPKWMLSGSKNQVNFVNSKLVMQYSLKHQGL